MNLYRCCTVFYGLKPTRGQIRSSTVVSSFLSPSRGPRPGVFFWRAVRGRRPPGLIAIHPRWRNRHFPLHSAREDERTSSELSLQGKAGKFHLDLTGLRGDRAVIAGWQLRTREDSAEQLCKWSTRSQLLFWQKESLKAVIAELLRRVFITGNLSESWSGTQTKQWPLDVPCSVINKTVTTMAPVRKAD